MEKRILSIDIETCGGKDLAGCGVYSYAEGEDFDILLFAYAFDEEEVRVVDFKNKEVLPSEVREALINSEVIKTAFNANFERTCLSKYFNIKLPAEQWRCTQVLARSAGLPPSLELVAKELCLPEKKLMEGKKLIKQFSLGSEGAVEGKGEEWESFKAYCKRDVEVERAVRQRLSKYELSSKEQRLWVLDQEINDYGVKADVELIARALECDAMNSLEVKKELFMRTGLNNPNSAAQLKKWLLEKEGLKVDSLSKEKVEELLEGDLSEDTKQVLRLRQELSKTSIKKYEAMDRSICSDGRIRGLLQFYGANRTGRWSGKLVQVQNLPQNKLQNLEEARSMLKSGSYEDLKEKYENIPELLSQLIRTAFVPREGSRFIVADFSAIEARIIAWLAGEKWRMEVFKSQGKIYEESASRMFGVPVEEITKDSPLRQKGKIAELALGYQGSFNALASMGALKMGLCEKEIRELVSAWRRSNGSIVKFWYVVERAAIKAVKERTMLPVNNDLHFYTTRGDFFIALPSGRTLSYINPELEMHYEFNKQRLTYEGMDQTSKQWTRLDTYGGKLVENIVQAIARDCLGETMLRLSAAGYKILMHVHDGATRF